jgi:hypothetical protein
VRVRGRGFPPTRTHDDGPESRCPSCSWKHTRKEENPEGAYVFFPGDIYAAFSDDVPPHIPLTAGGRRARWAAFLRRAWWEWAADAVVVLALLAAVAWVVGW